MNDPDGWAIYDQMVAAAQDDPDIYLFTNYSAASRIDITAFQLYSSVIIQKSIREGFGFVVSEALWKSNPVVVGRASGIPLQLEDSQDRYLVNSG